MWQVGYSAGLPHGRVFASMGAFDRSRTVEGMRRLLLEGAEQREALSDGVDRAPEHFVPFEAGLPEARRGVGWPGGEPGAAGPLLRDRAQADVVGQEEDVVSHDERVGRHWHRSIPRALLRRRGSVFHDRWNRAGSGDGLWWGSAAYRHSPLPKPSQGRARAASAERLPLRWRQGFPWIASSISAYRQPMTHRSLSTWPGSLRRPGRTRPWPTPSLDGAA